MGRGTIERRFDGGGVKDAFASGPSTMLRMVPLPTSLRSKGGTLAEEVEVFGGDPAVDPVRVIDCEEQRAEQRRLDQMPLEVEPVRRAFGLPGDHLLPDFLAR